MYLNEGNLLVEFRQVSLPKIGIWPVATKAPHTHPFTHTHTQTHNYYSYNCPGRTWTAALWGAMLNGKYVDVFVVTSEPTDLPCSAPTLYSPFYLLPPPLVCLLSSFNVQQVKEELCKSLCNIAADTRTFSAL